MNAESCDAYSFTYDSPSHSLTAIDCVLYTTIQLEMLSFRPTDHLRIPFRGDLETKLCHLHVKQLRSTCYRLDLPNSIQPHEAPG